MTIEFLSYALPGFVVLLLGVAWSWEYAAAPRSSSSTSPSCCRALAARHPVQGFIKLTVSLVGIIASLSTTNPSGSFHYVGDVHFASVYMLFALSGLVDVLCCYFPYAVGRGPARLALTLAFLVEALVFYDLSTEQDESEGQRYALALLIAVMAVCGFFTALAGALPGVEAARCVATLVHGSWFSHCGILLHWPSSVSVHPGRPSLWITLVFSWHCAAALSLLVILLLIRRAGSSDRTGVDASRERTSPQGVGQVSSPLNFCACTRYYHTPFSNFSTISTA